MLVVFCYNKEVMIVCICLFAGLCNVSGFYVIPVFAIHTTSALYNIVGWPFGNAYGLDTEHFSIQ